METNEIQNEIMKSKNRGLFITLIEEINKHSWGLAIKRTYTESLILSAFVFDKDWKEVYLK